jgi:hypothetical protein
LRGCTQCGREWFEDLAEPGSVLALRCSPDSLEQRS